MSDFVYDHEAEGDFPPAAPNAYDIVSRQKLEAIRTGIEQHFLAKALPLMRDEAHREEITSLLRSYGPMYAKTLNQIERLVDHE